MSAWALKDARASCETVFERAFGGEPQVVLRHGRPSLVVITYADYAAARAKPRPARRRRNAFLDFMRTCPVDLSTLDLVRDADAGLDRAEALA